ncbi:MAG: reprolysin-like metallopeptidase, partial [Bacteroidota bacterium]
MKTLHTLFIYLLVASTLCAQGNIWSESTSTFTQNELKERLHTPDKYRTLAFNADNFLNTLGSPPSRTADVAVQRTSNIMQFPMPDGSYQSFYVVDAELMHPDLAAKYPELKTYIGKGINDATADIRITYSPYHGFNGMIKSGRHSTIYIDPLTKDNAQYMVYHRAEVDRIDTGFTCSTPEPELIKFGDSRTKSSVAPLGDCNLRRYRLALSCTGEYAQYHIGQAGGSTGNVANDKAIVQSAMNVTMARVNGVYEKDLGITLQIIPNNDQVIYLNAASDPWNGEYSTQTAQTLDAVIGVNNYDIGHNFNTSGGGSAGCIDCVCLSASQSGTHKGRGYTGLPAPVGDPFDIDYVAHEMGHQFGGYHTQSNQSCRSGSGQTEVEPGSASTIMGYAGICAANVQNQSNDYFAYVNIRDIVTSINGGNASSCAQVIASGNAGPTANAGPDYTIPISTPFKLEGTGTDPDDAGLTYCWEQNDPENPNSNSAPNSTRTQGPMFRSFVPTTVPYRYMPRLSEIIANNSPTWEVLPSVSRNMEFSFTVRDNNTNSGCTDSDLMSVTTTTSAGPFVVNVPSASGIAWAAG